MTPSTFATLALTLGTLIGALDAAALHPAALLGSAASSAASASAGTCAPDQFRCRLGKTRCISRYWECDNVWDCEFGDDESNCQHVHKCPAGDFMCLSGECLLRTQRCDGHADCEDASDERGCSAPVPAPIPMRRPLREQPRISQQQDGQQFADGKQFMDGKLFAESKQFTDGLLEEERGLFGAQHLATELGGRAPSPQRLLGATSDDDDLEPAEPLDDDEEPGTSFGRVLLVIVLMTALALLAFAAARTLSAPFRRLVDGVWEDGRHRVHHTVSCFTCHHAGGAEHTSAPKVSQSPQRAEAHSYSNPVYNE